MMHASKRMRELQVGTGMTDAKRKWMRRGLIGLGGTVVLGIALTIAVSRLLEPARMADWLEPRLSSALKRDVSIGTAGIRLIPLRVRLGALPGRCAT